MRPCPVVRCAHHWAQWVMLKHNHHRLDSNDGPEHGGAGMSMEHELSSLANILIASESVTVMMG